MNAVRSIAFLLFIATGFGPVNTVTIKSTSLQSIDRVECGSKAIGVAKLTPSSQEQLKIWLETQVTKPPPDEWSLVYWSVAPAECSVFGSGFRIAFYKDAIFYTFSLPKYDVSFRRSSVGTLDGLKKIALAGAE
jgi:hypothetical protein